MKLFICVLTLGKLKIRGLLCGVWCTSFTLEIVSGNFPFRYRTSKPSAQLDSLPGCGLILPDTRDYNKVITASLRKPLEDVEFEIMIENFAQELRPGSRPGSKSLVLF